LAYLPKAEPSTMIVGLSSTLMDGSKPLMYTLCDKTLEL